MRQIAEMDNPNEFSAAAAEDVMSLDHINLGPDFVAVAGTFSDHAFLEYLDKQVTIDYVEQNSIFKSTTIRPRKDDEEEDDGDEEKVYNKEAVNRVRSRASNWGLARINSHQRGNLEEYEFDTMGG